MSKYSHLFGHNRVTHRAIGDIPGCTPAIDVFIERTVDEVREYLMQSAERYIYVMQTTDAKLWKNHPIHSERALPAFRNL